MDDNETPSRYSGDSEMRYNKTMEARFISRPNRFIAQVEIARKLETVYIKNHVTRNEL